MEAGGGKINTQLWNKNPLSLKQTQKNSNKKILMKKSRLFLIAKIQAFSKALF